MTTDRARRERRGGQAAGRAGGQRRDRRLQGVRAAAAAHRVRARRTGRADRVGAALRRRGHLGGAVRPPRRRPRSGTTSTRCRTCASARRADLVVVAPATADMLAKAAHGLADDLLTNTLLTARCPVVFAPAMHTEMWEHPATQENVATLRRRGAIVIEPAVGRLTGVDTGKGRLPDPGEIFEVCRRVLARGAGGRAGPGRPPCGDQRRRHPRAARPGPLPRQPLLRQAGLRAGPYRRRPRRPGHPGRGQHRAARPGRAPTWCGSAPRSSCGRRCSRPPRTPTPW